LNLDAKNYTINVIMNKYLSKRINTISTRFINQIETATNNSVENFIDTLVIKYDKLDKNDMMKIWKEIYDNMEIKVNVTFKDTPPTTQDYPRYPSNYPRYPSNYPRYPSNYPRYPSNYPRYPSNYPKNNKM
jgi:hypothetical protein